MLYCYKLNSKSNKNTHAHGDWSMDGHALMYCLKCRISSWATWQAMISELRGVNVSPKYGAHNFTFSST